MIFYKNPKYVKLTPIATTALLELANLGQLWTMWTKHTALGQNVWSWVMVNLALLLWHNWYKMFTPDQKFAIWSVRVGIAINTVVMFTVWHFS